MLEGRMIAGYRCKDNAEVLHVVLRPRHRDAGNGGSEVSLWVLNSYREYASMLESGSSTDVMPKTLAMQMFATLSESIISICEGDDQECNISSSTAVMTVCHVGIDVPTPQRVGRALASVPVKFGTTEPDAGSDELAVKLKSFGIQLASVYGMPGLVR